MTLPVDPDILEIPFRTLGAAFTEFADRHPDKIAIHSIDQSASLTFGDLQRLTDRAAARMISDGVTRGDRVAILAGECIEKLVLMFAAWRCGASACPFHSEIAADHSEIGAHSAAENSESVAAHPSASVSEWVARRQVFGC